MAVDPTDMNIKGMVDIADKPPIRRVGIAQGRIYLSSESILHIKNKTNPKGDVLENAKLAAIIGVKKTPELVFMCHPIKITNVSVNFDIHDDHIICQTQVKAMDRTGVEIEAIAGVMNALLAIFDLSKRYEKDVDGRYQTARITDVSVVQKIKEM